MLTLIHPTPTYLEYNNLHSDVMLDTAVFILTTKEQPGGVIPIFSQDNSAAQLRFAISLIQYLILM